MAGASDDEDGGMDVDALETRNESITAATARAGDAEALEMLEARKLGRSMAIPTDDAKVRHRLRVLGEPVSVFGERPPDRRERLREVLVRLAQEDGERGPRVSEAGDEDSDDEEQDEEFFTEGSDGLVQARKDIAAYSLRKGAKRIARQRLEATIPLQRIIATRKEIFAPLHTFTNLGSQIADSRPISMVRFSPDGQLLATGSWSGGVKVWESSSAKQTKVLRGHTDKVGGLSWHPQATLSQSTSALNLATGAADSQVLLWSLDSDIPIATLRGHQARVARVDFHPSGRYVASASFDGTWRLWDADAGKELLSQEGHSKEVYAVAFQPDGALVASGGLDAIGRIWDCRTGRCSMILDGHAREILSVCWSSNAYTAATSSADDTIKIWDIRSLKESQTIPAHKSNVSDVRFFASADESVHLPSGSAVIDGEGANVSEATVTTASGPGADKGVPLPRSGTFLASAGYDSALRIWSADDFKLLRTIETDSKAMSVDISPQGNLLASGQFSRTFKLFGNL